MPPAIQTFAQWCLVEPVKIEIARREVASTVSHAFYPVSIDQRDELLLALLKQTDYHSVMIFTRTRREADEVTGMIKSTGQTKVAAMHSDINQTDRMKALAGFKSGEFEILAFTILTADELDFAKSVEIYVNQTIIRRKLEDFPYTYTALLDDEPSKPIRKKKVGGKKRR